MPQLKLRRPWQWNPETQKYELAPKPKRPPRKRKAPGAPRKGTLSATSRAKVRPDDPRGHGADYVACLAHCRALIKYWADRGHEVSAQPKLVEGTDDRYRMETDLVNGCPKGFNPPRREDREMIRLGSGATRQFRMSDIQ